MKKQNNIQEYLENLFLNDIYEPNKILSLEETIEVNNFLCTLEEKIDFIINNTKVKSNSTDDLYFIEKFGKRAAGTDIVKPDQANEKEKDRITKIINNQGSSLEDDKLLGQLEDYYNNIDCDQKRRILIQSLDKYISLAMSGTSNSKHAEDFIDKLKDIKKRTEEFTFEPRLR